MIDRANGLEALSDFVQTTAASGVARQALLLRTERLPASLSRAERLRRARAALDPLTAAERARWHDLPGGRIVISWKGDGSRLVSQAMDGIQRVLQDDPTDPAAMGEVVDLFDLPTAGQALLAAAVAGLPIVPAEPVADTKRVPDHAKLQPLAAAELDRLEQSLAGTDVSRFARRRPICRYDGQVARLAWEERTLSVPELIDAVAPGRDARADAWLFRRLTRLLDRRMLSILSDAKELRTAGAFSLTLNVASVLSQEFLRFDAALPPALRGKVVVSFLPADIASDTAAFAFARNFARSRSYRICLRAISAALLPALELPALDLDFAQLIWSTDLGEIDRLPPAGRTRWIVGQPCTRDAVDWGFGHGVGLFTIKPTE